MPIQACNGIALPCTYHYAFIQAKELGSLHTEPEAVSLASHILTFVTPNFWERMGSIKILSQVKYVTMWPIDRKHIYMYIHFLKEYYCGFFLRKYRLGSISTVVRTFVLNEKIYGLPFYHFHIAESFDELWGCACYSSESYIVRHTKRKGIKEYKRRKTIFPRFKIDPRSFLQVFSYINHFLPIYYSLYSYNLYQFVFLIFNVLLNATWPLL